MELKKFKRHICNCCKRKLYEKDMEKALTFRGDPKLTRYGKEVWICFKCKGKGRETSVY